MSDRLLKSWTRAPLIVDRRNAELTLLQDLPPTPQTVPAQQAVSDVDADLGSEATQRFALDTVGTPAWPIGRSGGDPRGEFHHLRLGEVEPSGSFECSIEPVLRTPSQPDIDGSRHHAGGLGRHLDGQAITHVGERQQTGASMGQPLAGRLGAQIITGLRQAVDPGSPPCALGSVLLVWPCGNQQLFDLGVDIGVEARPALPDNT